MTSIISNQEWIRLSEAARQAFPNEVLARGEIMRRFSLSGVAALKAASYAEKKKAQQEHQATMCVVRPEGDKGGTPGNSAAAGCGSSDIAQTLLPENIGECLWPTEKLSAGEVTRRLAVTQPLWAESERGLWIRCERAAEARAPALRKKKRTLY